MKKQIPSPILAGLLSLLILFTMACAVGGQTPTQSADLAATQDALMQTQVALSVQQTVAAQPNTPADQPAAETQAAPTQAPAQPAASEAPAFEGNPFSFEGISFTYHPTIASSVSAQIIAEMHSEMADSFNEPRQYAFEFQGYAINPTFHTPMLRVYPVNEYIAINPDVSGKIADLQSAIQNQSMNLSHMPFLPQWNAAQMLSMQVQYLTFQNGQGVRYLTQYGQAAWPINNQDMFYTFQGITNDGQYYISAVLPVSHPSLPANGDAYPGDIMTLSNDYENYLNTIQSQINPQPAESFTPQLNRLDDMIASLLVQP